MNQNWEILSFVLKIYFFFIYIAKNCLIYKWNKNKTFLKNLIFSIDPVPSSSLRRDNKQIFVNQHYTAWIACFKNKHDISNWNTWIIAILAYCIIFEPSFFAEILWKFYFWLKWLFSVCTLHRWVTSTRKMRILPSTPKYLVLEYSLATLFFIFNYSSTREYSKLSITRNE